MNCNPRRAQERGQPQAWRLGEMRARSYLVGVGRSTNGFADSKSLEDRRSYLAFIEFPVI